MKSDRDSDFRYNLIENKYFTVPLHELNKCVLVAYIYFSIEFVYCLCIFGLLLAPFPFSLSGGFPWLSWSFYLSGTAEDFYK